MLSDLAKIVHQNEPGVLVYRITRGSVSEDGSQDIRMVEQYVLHILTIYFFRTIYVIFFCFTFSGRRGRRGKMVDR